MLQCAHLIQQHLPEAVPVGGFGAAVHTAHRLSYDVDSVMRDLAGNFDQVLRQMEQLAGWDTSRTRRPVLILGRLRGIEVGLRQLRRAVPLETEQLDVPGVGKVTIPTSDEMLRTKAWMISSRNAVRDYMDTVAIADLLGDSHSAQVLAGIGRYYPEVTREGQPPLKHILERLALPEPTVPAGQTIQSELGKLDVLQSRYSDWDYIANRARHLAAQTLLLSVQPDR
jgi:hypothetical protein